jgi:anthraniloyl-CoA monooxygenase
VTHEHLKNWAPHLVREVDALAAGALRGRNGAPPPPMLTPYKLGDLTLPNRIVMSPMCMYSADDGTVNDFHMVHYGSRAIGGAGLIIAEMTDVTREGRISTGCAGMYKPEHVPAWKRIVDFVHKNSETKIGVQLAHAGRKGSITTSWEGHAQLSPDKAWTTLAASAIPFDADRTAPKAMDRADMDVVSAAFVNAAKMSHEAGFDMIELHFAHGYLLSSFISPLSNHRTDEYGGTLENRMRYPLEVLRAVRRAWPSHKPITVRISAYDFLEGGTTIDDSIIMSRWLRDAGADMITVSTGAVTADRRPMIGRLYQTTYSDQIRNETKIPTMAVGGIASFADANTIIAAGRADLCAMARGYMFDPYFPRHAAHQQGFNDMRWPNQYRGANALVMRDF